jgi:hypothetical protein
LSSSKNELLAEDLREMGERGDQVLPARLEHGYMSA